jgi:hypothetical protein
MANEDNSKVFIANGLVKGVLIPETNLLIGEDGTQYPCTIAPKLRAWFERHPDEAAQARAFVVYPRTVKGQGLQFHVVGSPKLPESQLERQAGIFQIQGVVTNLRGVKNQTVVRIRRNVLPPAGEHKHHSYAVHLLFLSGRVTPSELFVGQHVRFTCRLQGHDLKIQGAHPLGEPELDWLSFGSATIPWPFHPRKTGTWAQYRRATDVLGPFICTDQQRRRLPELIAERLADLERLVKRLKTGERYASDPTFNRDVDRLRLVHRRLDEVVARAGRDYLLQMVEQYGLLSLLNRTLAPVSDESAPAATPAAKPAAKPAPKAKDTSPKPKAMPAATTPQVSPFLARFRELLAAGMLDERIMLTLDCSRDDIRAAVRNLESAGLLDATVIAKARSYQLKRHLKSKSPAASKQPAAV